LTCVFKERTVNCTMTSRLRSWICPSYT